MRSPSSWTSTRGPTGSSSAAPSTWPSPPRATWAPGAAASSAGASGCGWARRSWQWTACAAISRAYRWWSASTSRRREGAMRTLIEGGWVVAFNGTTHEVYEGGAVVFEDDRIVHAGGPYAGPADARLSARGKLVSPGFINTHVHTAGNGGDYLLLDMAKNDYRTANYMAFAAPLKGAMKPPPPEAVAAIREFVFLHALKGGTTTIIDVGGLRGDWDGYVRIVDELGVRVYGGPSFRDRNTFCDERGRLYYDVDTEAGAQGLKAAVEFIRASDGAAQG